MHICLNRYFHILSFRILGSNISYGISPKIEWLELVRLCPDGYMEFQTNVGLEGIDLFDEDSNLVSQKQKDRILQKLETLSIESVKVRIE